MKPAGSCPCGSGDAYDACCGRWHRGEAAPNAEKLMRSRYVAHVLALDDYLLATWHPATRPAVLDLSAPPRPQWLGLAVKAHVPLGAARAMVEFVARYRIAGRVFRMHERSRFERIDGRWFYVAGDGRT
jgi:SEC-C motif-containing protein